MATPKERLALLAVIQDFKPPELSDLDAALNTIIHHAATIQRLQQAVAELTARLDAIRGEAISAMRAAQNTAGIKGGRAGMRRPALRVVR